MIDATAKPALRRAIRAARAAHVATLDASGRVAASHAIASHALTLFGKLDPTQCIAGYVAVGEEADPAPLMQALAGQPLALPHIAALRGPMRFLAWHPGDPLETGPGRLQQPCAASAEVAPAVVLMPLVAFDDAGNRLGQGAGHYDRALAALPSARRVAIAWACQRVAAIPAEPHDLPLDAVVTELGVTQFPRKRTP